MASVREIRSRLLELVRHGLAFPFTDPEVALGALLACLADIDGRTAKLIELRRPLEKQNRWKQLGLSSALIWTFGKGNSHYGTEIASIHAEFAYRLDLLGALPTVPADRWRKLVRWGRMCHRADHTEADVVAACGTPGFRSGGHGYDHLTLAYIPADPGGRWLFFDFAIDRDGQRVPPLHPWSKIDRYLLLRNVRLPVDDFYKGLVLTPYGRRIAAKRITPDSKYPRAKLADALAPRKRRKKPAAPRTARMQR